MDSLTDISIGDGQPDAKDSASSAFQSVDVEGDVVTLHSFQLQNPEVAAYLTEIAEDERAFAVARAIEVGVFCLERASTARNTDFFKREIDRLLGDLKSNVGTIPTAIQEKLMAKVGTENGQVLRPIVDAANRVTVAVNQRIADVKDLLSKDLDPAKPTSSLGSALAKIKSLLEPTETGSIQFTLDAAVSRLTAEDGALAKAVREVVKLAVEPLKSQVESLTLEVRGQEAAQEALMQTTEKGTPYELQVVDGLQPWAQATGSCVQRVGDDNRPGDILLTMAATSVAATELRIIIEARDRANPIGRKGISDDLSKKMAERSANAAIYLSHTRAGLGNEIGDWGEGECELGSWVATTHENLLIAVRFLIQHQRLRTLRSESPQFDGSAIENQIVRIQTSMKRISQINRKVTEVRSAAECISSEADTLRSEVQDAVRTMEDAVRKIGVARSSE
jgi:hypothetical protein